MCFENDDNKLLWDFSVGTDHEIGSRRRDLVIIDKRDKGCQIIDAAIPENGRVREKEDEKVEKYQDLAREVRKMWVARTKVIPVVVGALGSIPLRLNDNLIAIEVGIPVGLIQRCALLGSERILSPGQIGIWRCCFLWREESRRT